MSDMVFDLPGAAARELYREILREGGRIRIAGIRPEDEAAVKQLADLGLLVLRVADGAYSAVNPRAVSERIGAELREESARLLARAALVPDLLEDLTQAYDAAPRRAEPGNGVRRVAGLEQVRHVISQFTKDFPHDILAAQPGRTHSPEHREDSLAHTRRYIECGGSIRMIHGPRARSEQEDIEFAVTTVRAGSQVRVLDAPFSRIMIFDRSVALLSVAADNEVAVVVEDSAVVVYLVALFEEQWRQARIVDWESLAADSGPAVHEQVGRLLGQGLTQRAIASRMRLSERTVAGHIARLRELYDAETLFQLGWQMRGTRPGGVR
ncbi:LuxR family transcriptional regulator [Kitasatospora sp. SUK 42]|uniref:LuxR family transcriptional regulator n=1 Tax=Kitasatospora sp. SUK 42 TaxID=1588882 RepID=UPI0018C92B6D|nr:LuxR family transcriptional regulator [Kitasatospora sp. SUK 42]MBV2152911.1 LuxR family transcriptional regulator [Kitasatospora sp. SUK 42]